MDENEKASAKRLIVSKPVFCRCFGKMFERDSEIDKSPMEEMDENLKVSA